MSILYAFIFGGLVCLIAQIIYDNTKLSSGHITSLFVSIGAILEFFNLYDFYIMQTKIEPIIVTQKG